MSLFQDTLYRNKCDTEMRASAIVAAKDDIGRLELIANWINSSGYSATPHVLVVNDAHTVTLCYLINVTASKKRLNELLLLMQRRSIEAERNAALDNVWELRAFGDLPISLHCFEPIMPKRAAPAERRVAA